MGFRIRPVDASFYDLFAQQAEHLVTGARLLAQMLSSDGDRDQAARQLGEAEHAADETTHAIVRRVNSTFVTPFDREDIYALASHLDDVIDSMEKAAELMQVYRVTSLPTGFSELVEVIARCAEVTHQAMPTLQAMKDLDEYWIEINRLENTGDKIFRRALGALFDGDLSTKEIIKLKDILEALEETVDAFEDVANTVETIAVKES